MSTNKKNLPKSVLPIDALDDATAAIAKVKKIPLVQEFSDFIARGNVIDLAVGVTFSLLSDDYYEKSCSM